MKKKRSVICVHYVWCTFTKAINVNVWSHWTRDSVLQYAKMNYVWMKTRNCSLQHTLYASQYRNSGVLPLVHVCRGRRFSEAMFAIIQRENFFTEPYAVWRRKWLIELRKHTSFPVCYLVLSTFGNRRKVPHGIRGDSTETRVKYDTRDVAKRNDSWA